MSSTSNIQSAAQRSMQQMQRCAYDASDAAKSRGDNITRGARDTFESTKNNSQAHASNLGESAGNAASCAQEKATQAKDAAGEKLGQAKHTADEKLHDAQKGAQNGAQKVKETAQGKAEDAQDGARKTQGAAENKGHEAEEESKGVFQRIKEAVVGE